MQVVHLYWLLLKCILICYSPLPLQTNSLKALSEWCCFIILPLATFSPGALLTHQKQCQRGLLGATKAPTTKQGAGLISDAAELPLFAPCIHVAKE